MDAQKRIKQLMDERGWTDYRLAKEANLSHSTVTNMFNRNNAPTLPTLEAVCKAFGITLGSAIRAGGFIRHQRIEICVIVQQNFLQCRWLSVNRSFD